MLILVLLELVGAATLIAVAVTQLIVPLVRGTTLFPWFRSAEPALQRQRAAALQHQRERSLRDEIDTLNPKEPSA